MNISIKSSKEIQIMKQGGEKLSQILTNLIQSIKPGTNLLEIEKRALQLIKVAGGEPAFARVPGYHWATCLNINEEIVHGIPKDYQIREGDVVNVDIGLYYQEFNTDMSTTIKVQNSTCLPARQELKVQSDKEIDLFLATGRRALEEAKKQAIPGNRVGHISKKIQEIIESAGFNCARNLTGHGIGKKLHEPPAIPCLLDRKLSETPLLKEGMTLAIEVIYTQGKPDLIVGPDRWTIKTKDGKISAVFEETIAVTKNEPLVLTELPLLSG